MATSHHQPELIFSPKKIPDFSATRSIILFSFPLGAPRSGTTRRSAPEPNRKGCKERSTPRGWDHDWSVELWHSPIVSGIAMDGGFLFIFNNPQSIVNGITVDRGGFFLHILQSINGIHN